MNKKKLYRSNLDEFHYAHCGFGEILDDIESKSPQWRRKAIAIDKFSLQFFPVLFAVVTAIYAYFYLSGYVK